MVRRVKRCFPLLIPKSVLPNAVALNAILWKGAALLGPMLGGVAISLMGTSGAFYANAASFFVVVSALLMMRTSSPAADTGRHFAGEVKAGLSYVFSHNVILGVIVMEATTSIFGLDNALLTIFASDILRVGAHGFGLLQSARGLGAVLGSSFYIAYGQRPYQGKILLASALLYSIGFIIFGYSPSFLFSLLLLTFVGAMDTIWAAARSTILQWIGAGTTARPYHGHLPVEQPRAQSPRSSGNRSAGAALWGQTSDGVGRHYRRRRHTPDRLAAARGVPFSPGTATSRSSRRPIAAQAHGLKRHRCNSLCRTFKFPAGMIF